MNGTDTTNLKHASLSTSRLASRLGIQPAHIQARRRAGELLGVRPAGSWEYHYPAWQFNGGGTALPSVARLIRASRSFGVDDVALYELLTSRVGLVDGNRVIDELRAGREEFVLDLVRRAAAAN